MRSMKYWVVIALLATVSCKKDQSTTLRYFEVGLHQMPQDWRDSSFVVATSNPYLLYQVDEQLKLPIDQRSNVSGKLLEGSAGYNKNGGHWFTWHFDENDWQLVNLSVEIYDGSPHTDLDKNQGYWFRNLKRFAPWGSYIKREIAPR